jgi:hypothetical protein
MEMCVAQSFSKNFGLYGQRVGAFHYVLNEGAEDLRDTVVNNLCHLIRGEYSMGPTAGCNIVKKVLTSPELTAKWHQDLKVMSSRIISMREALYNELVRLKTPGTWKHIVEQVPCPNRNYSIPTVSGANTLRRTECSPTQDLHLHKSTLLKINSTSTCSSPAEPPSVDVSLASSLGTSQCLPFSAMRCKALGQTNDTFAYSEPEECKLRRQSY